MKKSTIDSFRGMYVLIITASLIIMLGTSCSKKEEEEQTLLFNDIALKDITAKAADLISGGLVISDASGVLWNAGDIILFVTNQGRYGKLEVISVNANDNYKLTFKAVTYENTGVVHSQTSQLAIRGTWLCDLDTMSEIDEGTEAEDFWIQRETQTNTNLTSKSTARFLRYTN